MFDFHETEVIDFKDTVYKMLVGILSVLLGMFVVEILIAGLVADKHEVQAPAESSSITPEEQTSDEDWMKSDPPLVEDLDGMEVDWIPENAKWH